MVTCTVLKRMTLNCRSELVMQNNSIHCSAFGIGVGQRLRELHK